MQSVIVPNLICPTGLDFDGSPHTIFLGSGTRQMKVVNIPIIEDNLTEREEIFLLELRIIRVDPPENVYSDRNVTVVRITPSGKNKWPLGVSDMIQGSVKC